MSHGGKIVSYYVNGPLPFDDEGIVRQMPESVSINYHWHVERLTAVDHDGDASQHRLVSTQTGSYF